MKYRTTNAGRFALTGVALAASCFLSGQAWALGLGRLSVQSALGEQLRAEIDVTSATPEEASSLQLRVASPEVYRAAGLDYNPVLLATQVTVQRRADGRTVLRVTSDRAVVEPFLDVILEVNWASGRLVRSYTMLLDPPAARSAPPPVMAAAAAAPVVTPAPAPAQTRPAAVEASGSTAPAPTPGSRPAAAPAPAKALGKASAKTTGAAAPERVRVQSGDSLSRIASRIRTENVSLEQMLVSLYRANPDAFAGSNMNRLRAGAILDVPPADASLQIEPAEARRVILAQSSDFTAFRQRLAGSVAPAPAADAPARQAAGAVQAQVEDRKRTTPAADQLKLSQGGLKASAPDAALSAQAQRRDAAARVAELTRNVEELKSLQNAAAGSAAAARPAPAAAPAPAPVTAPAGTPPSAASASPPATPPAAAVVVAAAPPVAPPPAQPAAASAPKPRPEPAPVPASSFADSLLANPLVLPGAGLLLVGLLGAGLYFLRGRSRKPAGETSFLESRLQPDSFFGNSGGQRIDTREAPPSSSSSSMSYSLSQLDAIGDVDPVAEADVYLAYGRDLQAEEILKEAMRAAPDRQAIRLKMLEVYAKRRDIKGLEMLATQVFSMTRGEGEDWAKAQELGRSVDPDNTLYQPGGRPVSSTSQGVQAAMPSAVAETPNAPGPASTQPAAAPGQPTDLDLDFDAPGPLPDPRPAEMTQPVIAVAEQSVAQDLDFDLPEPSADAGLDFDLADPAEMTQSLPVGTEQSAAQDLDFDLPEPAAEAGLDFELPGQAVDAGLDFELPVTVELDAPPPPPPASGISSDFGTLDFDLDTATTERAPASGVDDSQLSTPAADFAPMSDYGSLSDDPLARKLELAEEFRQIGDLEGARDLLEEVIAKSDGSLQAKAQGMLDRLA